MTTKGNRCGHQPDAPRLDTRREIPNPIPPILVKAAEQWRKLYSSPHLEGFRHLARRHLDTGRERLTRSERREAVAALGAAMLQRADLASLQVFAPSKTLMDEAGLSESRYHRAMGDLKAAGLVDIKQERHGEGGTWKTVYVSIKIRRAIFSIIGMADWARDQIDRARKRAEKAARNIFKDAADAAKTRKWQRDLLRNLGKRKAKAEQAHEERRHEHADRYQQALLLVQQGLSLEEIRARLN